MQSAGQKIWCLNSKMSAALLGFQHLRTDGGRYQVGSSKETPVPGGRQRGPTVHPPLPHLPRCPWHWLLPLSAEMTDLSSPAVGSPSCFDDKGQSVFEPEIDRETLVPKRQILLSHCLLPSVFASRKPYVLSICHSLEWGGVRQICI